MIHTTVHFPFDGFSHSVLKYAHVRQANDREFYVCIPRRVSVWEFGGFFWKTESKSGNREQTKPCVATEEARKWTVVLITLIDGNLCPPKKTSRDNYYSLSRRCVLSFSSWFFFSSFFFIYSVLVARAAVTRFPFAHTHTIYPSIYPFHLPSFSVFFFFRETITRRQSPFFVCLFFFLIHRRASVFSPLPPFFFFPNRFVRFISFIKSVAIWIYTQQSADTLCDI